jgi:UbiD family decarboxylase
VTDTRSAAAVGAALSEPRALARSAEAPGHFQSLRDLLAHLEAHGKLKHVTAEVDKDWEITCITRNMMSEPPEKRYAIQFDRIARHSTSVVTGALGASREIYAMALGIPLQDGRIDKSAIHETWVRALANPRPCVVVNDAPCKQNIVKGSQVNLTDFPIPTWTPGKDAAPYLSAGCVVQKDPESGTQNCGVYRGMIQDVNRIGVLIQPGKHSWLIHQKYEKQNKSMEMAIVIGPPPYVGMTAVGRVPFGVDEFTVAGGLAKASVEVTRCETVDLLVPAHSEMIIEGVIKPGARANEGPFGEFFGYMGPQVKSPVLEVTAITYRDGTIHQAFQEQYPPSEGSTIKDIAMESILLGALRQMGIPGVLDVHVHPMSCQQHVIVQIKPQFAAHARAVMSGVWGAYPNRAKQVIVVEDDCDIYDDGHVAWHVATRVQPQRDNVLWSDATGIQLDPSMPRETCNYGSKIGIDATKSVAYPPVSLPPPEMLDGVRTAWAKYGLPALEG